MGEIVQAEVMHVAAMVGGVAFALSGFLVGARKNLDIMGIFILAFLTANGGGLIRDLLVDRPPAILGSMEPFWIAAGVTGLSLLFRVHKLETVEKRWFFIVCDAVGLVAFSITGSLIAIEEQVHFFGFLTLSFLTATGGGILRDLLVGNIPEILHSGFYGSIAILLSVAIYAVYFSGLLNPYSLLLMFPAFLSLRLIAYHYAWRLPKI
jgi:uncharacterized membrane protein YeiH